MGTRFIVLTGSWSWDFTLRKAEDILNCDDDKEVFRKKKNRYDYNAKTNITQLTEVVP